MKKAFLMLTLLLLASAAYASEGSITLLAVSEEGNISKGSTANLSLEITGGTGKVFIESFPFTKLDTQITTRFANEIACSYLENNCGSRDFFYTISSDSTIVGGPSAGAATTLLTIALLNKISLDKYTTVTGTINSGNIIGPVGGLKEKIDAASQIGISRVIIPKGDGFSKDENNQTIDLAEFGKSVGVEVIEAGTIDYALEIFTGKKTKERPVNFSINPEYAKTMHLLAEDLCNRSSEQFARLLNFSYSEGNVLDNLSAELEQEAINLSAKANNAMMNGSFYTAASFCYGANVKLGQVFLFEKNLSISEINKTAIITARELSKVEKFLGNKSIHTITDLEAYMIVSQRADEAREHLANVQDSLAKNDTAGAIFFLANAVERINSAFSWSNFFNNKGVAIYLNQDTLADSCRKKISEAEERVQYVALFSPEAAASIKRDVALAYADSQKKEYALCLFQASKSNADANVILSTIGVNDENLDTLLGLKLEAARKTIAEQNAKGFFPIFGYSYYEYAGNLRNENKASALNYAEYAIELSKLDRFFQKKSHSEFIDFSQIPALLIGIFIGFAVCEILRHSRKR